MTCKIAAILLSFLYCCGIVAAQKPFTEGIIVYKVQLESREQNPISGTYTFVIKGDQIRKEIKLSNGYQDVVILNCETQRAVSLQNRNGRKYAIELSMDQMKKDQERFSGFSLNNEAKENKMIAGLAVYTGNVGYHDSTTAAIYYSKEWRPSQAVMFERFPDAKFLPMQFFYKDAQGMTMRFEADKVQPGPVDNALFRIPHDAKIISYPEYKELSR